MSEYKLYSDIESKNTFLEIWGASTKHPDIMYCLQALIKKEQFQLSEYFDIERNMFQFILYCASRLQFDFDAYCLTSFAMTIQEEYFNNMLYINKKEGRL